MNFPEVENHTEASGAPQTQYILEKSWIMLFFFSLFHLTPPYSFLLHCFTYLILVINFCAFTDNAIYWSHSSIRPAAPSHQDMITHSYEHNHSHSMLKKTKDLPHFAHMEDWPQQEFPHVFKTVVFLIQVGQIGKYGSGHTPLLIICQV